MPVHDLKRHPSVEPFARRPWFSVVLALLALCMGAVFWLDLLPPALKYGRHHGGIMTLLCVLLSVYCGGCASLGFKR